MFLEIKEDKKIINLLNYDSYTLAYRAGMYCIRLAKPGKEKYIGHFKTYEGAEEVFDSLKSFLCSGKQFYKDFPVSE